MSHDGAKKPILSLDFDGCLHSYASGWKGADVIPDPPVPGAMRFVANAVNHFEVQVFSSRSNQPGGLVAMQEWMLRRLVDEFQGGGHDIAEMIGWPTAKPAAFLTIDDRAICFDGDWGVLDPKLLLNFQPWNKRQVGPTGKFPDGKISPGDRGELLISVRRDEENALVIINFGKPAVEWLGVPYEQAADLAHAILTHTGKVYLKEKI